MDDSSNPQQLDYAPRPSLKRRVWRRLGWVILFLLVGFIFIRIGPTTWRNLGIVLAQRKCLTYQPPTEQIVLSTRQSIHSVAPEWLDYYDRISPPGSAVQATVFLHERISPSGNRRLIYVGGGSQHIRTPPIYAIYALIYSARVFVPGTATKLPREVLSPPQLGVARDLRLAPGDLYAGQVDPNDSSHFTIRMRLDRSETIVDGWLRDDDTVLLEPRPSVLTPATTPADRD